MIDLNKVYQTESGAEVRLFAIIEDRVFGVFRYINENWQPASWLVTTGDQIGPDIRKRLSLVEVKPRHKISVWCPVYRPSVKQGYLGSSFLTRKHAAMNCPNATAIIHVELEYTEGEGLEGINQ